MFWKPLAYEVSTHIEKNYFAGEKKKVFYHSSCEKDIRYISTSLMMPNIYLANDSSRDREQWRENERKREWNLRSWVTSTSSWISSGIPKAETSKNLVDKKLNILIYLNRSPAWSQHLYNSLVGQEGGWEGAAACLAFQQQHALLPGWVLHSWAALPGSITQVW